MDFPETRPLARRLHRDGAGRPRTAATPLVSTTALTGQAAPAGTASKRPSETAAAGPHRRWAHAPSPSSSPRLASARRPSPQSGRISLGPRAVWLTADADDASPHALPGSSARGAGCGCCRTLGTWSPPLSRSRSERPPPISAACSLTSCSMPGRPSASSSTISISCRQARHMRSWADSSRSRRPGSASSSRRARAAFDLARLRLHGAVHELRGGDLLFTAEETQHLSRAPFPGVGTAPTSTRRPSGNRRAGGRSECTWPPSRRRTPSSCGGAKASDEAERDCWLAVGRNLAGRSPGDRSALARAALPEAFGGPSSRRWPRGRGRGRGECDPFALAADLCRPSPHSGGDWHAFHPLFREALLRRLDRRRRRRPSSSSTPVPRPGSKRRRPRGDRALAGRRGDRDRDRAGRTRNPARFRPRGLAGGCAVAGAAAGGDHPGTPAAAPRERLASAPAWPRHTAKGDRPPV